MNSFTEENYLKAIFKLIEQDGPIVTTNALAEMMQTKAATVTDMLKRLSAKKLVNYTKYQGVSLTPAGRRTAVMVIRKHRLWEYFLVEKLQFRWNEVHEIAEQLEHVDSPELVERLDRFLGKPKYDPHGDPIPDVQGRFAATTSALLSTAIKGKKYIMTGVAEHQPAFLEHLDKSGFALGCVIRIEQVTEYDRSLRISLDKRKNLYISNEVAKNIRVSPAD